MDQLHQQLNNKPGSIGAIWSKRSSDFLDVVGICYRIFRFLLFMICLERLIKAREWIPISFCRIWNFQSVHQIWTLGPFLLLQKYGNEQFESVGDPLKKTGGARETKRPARQYPSHPIPIHSNSLKLSQYFLR